MTTETSLAQKGFNSGLDQLRHKPVINSFFRPVDKFFNIWQWLITICVNVHVLVISTATECTFYCCENSEIIFNVKVTCQDISLFNSRFFFLVCDYKRCLYFSAVKIQY